jgi:hypothetical protein
MSQIIVQSKSSPASGPCGFCGEPTRPGPTGTQLVVAVSEQPVCLDCAKKHAPSLAALVDLANEAERVGRIGRHTVFPPYTALLDLARAADNYTSHVEGGGPPTPPPSSPPSPRGETR